MNFEMTNSTVAFSGIHARLQSLDGIAETLAGNHEGNAEAVSVMTWDPIRGSVGLAPVDAAECSPGVQRFDLETESNHHLSVTGPTPQLLGLSTHDYGVKKIDLCDGSVAGLYIPQITIQTPSHGFKPIEMIACPVRTPNGIAHTDLSEVKVGIRLDKKLGMWCGVLAGHTRFQQSSCDDLFRAEASRFLASTPANRLSDFAESLPRRSHDAQVDCDFAGYGMLLNFYIDMIRGTHEGKRLPEITFQTNQEFRVGLLAGLISAAGNVVFLSGPGQNAYQTLYAVTAYSESFAQEVVSLANSLGIRATACLINSPSAQASIKIYLPWADVVIAGVDEYTRDPMPRSNSTDVDSDDCNARSVADPDAIPCSEALGNWFLRFLPINHITPLLEATLDASETGEIGRNVAEELIQLVEAERVTEPHQHFDTFRRLTRMTNVRWHRVLKFEERPMEEGSRILSLRGRDNYVNSHGFVLPAVCSS